MGGGGVGRCCDSKQRDTTTWIIRICAVVVVEASLPSGSVFLSFSFQAGCPSRPALDHELWPTDNTDSSRHQNLPSPE